VLLPTGEPSRSGILAGPRHLGDQRRLVLLGVGSRKTLSSGSPSSWSASVRLPPWRSYRRESRPWAAWLMAKRQRP